MVIIQCPGCQARHLIADRLGWFGKMGSVEDFLAEHGESECLPPQLGRTQVLLPCLQGAS